MSIELPPLPDLSMFVPSDADRCQMKSEIRAYARAAVDAALERAAQECRVICGKNHADAATFKNGTKAYVQACDDCEDAIRALGEQHD